MDSIELTSSCLERVYEKVLIKQAEELCYDLKHKLQIHINQNLGYTNFSFYIGDKYNVKCLDLVKPKLRSLHYKFNDGVITIYHKNWTQQTVKQPIECSWCNGTGIEPFFCVECKKETVSDKGLICERCFNEMELSTFSED